MRWVEAMITFKTIMPNAKCGGRVMLFPETDESDAVVWKIWSLSTWVDSFDEYPEDQNKLKAAGRDFNNAEHMETDVLIIGGGNAYVLCDVRMIISFYCLGGKNRFD